MKPQSLVGGVHDVSLMEKVTAALHSDYCQMRTAGLPFGTLGRLRSVRTVDAVDTCISLEEQLARERQHLCDLIYESVPNAPGAAERASLLDAKRAVFKFAPVPTSHVDTRNETLRRRLDLWNDGVKALQDSRELAATAYDADNEEVRRALWTIAKDPLLLDGLVVTNRQLYDRLRAHRSDAQAKASRRVRALESALARYVARIATRPTPLGRFASVAIHRRRSRSRAGTTVQSPSHSDVKASTAVFELIATRLASDPRTRQLATLRLNPSLTVEAGGLLWMDLRYVGLTTEGKGLMVAERLRRLARRADVEALVAEIRRAPARSLREWAGCALPHLLEGLIAAGIAELVTPVPTLNADYLTHLLRVLTDYPSDLAKRVATDLATLRGLLASFADAPHDERRALAEVIEARLATAVAMGGAPVCAARGRHAIVEDAYDTSPISPAVQQTLERIQPTLATWHRVLLAFDLAATLKADLAHRVETAFGTDARLPFTTFVAWLAKDGRVGRHSDARRHADEVRTRLTAWWQRGMTAAREEWHIDVAELDELLRPAEPPCDWRSIAFLCEVQRDEQGTHKTLITAEYPGFGKCFTRFAGGGIQSWSSERAYAQLRALYRLVGRGGRAVVDIGATLGYAANARPCLTPYELRAPLQVQSLPPHRVIDLNEIQVRVTAGVLGFHSTRLDNPVLPLDLGLVTLLRRPLAYDALNILSPLFSVPSRPPSPTFSGRTDRLPRVRLGDVILQRRRWRFATRDLPEPDACAPAVRNFERLRQWQRRADLPDECWCSGVSIDTYEGLLEQFLESRRRGPTPGGATTPPAQDWTAAYVDFRSRHLVDSLARARAKAPNRVEIEEVWLDGCSPCEPDGRRREYIVELHRPPHAALHR